MRLHVVSDVHGSTDALRAASVGADALVCLGDLVLFIDYDDHGAGILADLFGADAASRYIEMRSQLRFDEAREFSRELWESLDRDRGEVIEEAIRAQYSVCSPRCRPRRTSPMAMSTCRGCTRST